MLRQNKIAEGQEAGETEPQGFCRLRKRLSFSCFAAKEARPKKRRKVFLAKLKKKDHKEIHFQTGRFTPFSDRS